ncbi:MAG TPA: prolyl oligopeptidase family serine peptidase [Rudaea sp.]|nr:prolyl oligopeptidase family serine peptidase [Rudaea sp.]
MRITLMLPAALALVLAACQGQQSARPAPQASARKSAADSNYPVAKTGNQVDDYHGTKIADPYRWMEDVDSSDTHAWIEAENKLTFGKLAQIPGRDRIREKLSAVWNYEKFSPPEKFGDHYFYTRNDGLQNQSVLYVTESLDAEPRVLLDPNKLSNDGTVALKSYAISNDGKFLAYGLSSGGSDWEEWHVLDVDKARNTDDVLKWVKFSGASWRRDGTGFFYSRYDEPKGENALKAANKFQKLYFHRLGTKQSDDQLIYERKDQPDWMFGGVVSDDGRYLIISVSRSTEPKNLVLYRDLAKKNADAVVETLIGEWDASYQFINNSKDKLYFLTDNDAPRYRVISVDIKKPDKDHWHEVVGQAQDTLQNCNMIDHLLVAEYMKDAHTAASLFDANGHRHGAVDLPGIGTAAGFTGRTFDKETFYTFSSFTTPPSVFRFDLTTKENSLFRAPKVAFDASPYETKQVFYASKDGTKIPMFITAKKNVAMDGSNPTILYGYGGFNIPIQPGFSPSVAAWLELGGVYAVANLRGGGEYGREWHEAGIKTHKQNVFDDFIAGAEYLIREKYTSPPKLAIRGASNGGLLVGATELQRPDLFAAAIPQVGVLDMLRFRDFTIGRAWESDYGSVENADEFNALRAYSPVHNVKSGVDYPATMIITGDHDDRVFPAHSFKFAATMQAADPHGKPILIRIETRAGHGQGKPTTMQIDEVADVYAFILNAFGETK